MLLKLLTFFIELPDKLKGLFIRLFYKNHLKAITKKDKQYARYAIICLFDKSHRPDLIALLTKLKQSGVGLIGVSSNDADKQYSDLLDIRVRVSSLGRDFLAYQQGYEVFKQLTHLSSIKSICFINDSVWYFEKYQGDIISKLIEGMDEGKLVSGTKIFDEVPHVSGWFFGINYNESTAVELNQLFTPNFARKSRQYNIRQGEHKILTSLASIKGIQSLDKESNLQVYAYCYTAVSKGSECFYLKADATSRTNPSNAQLEKFLTLNADEEEYLPALRWITSKADALLNSPLRRLEITVFRHHHFSTHRKAD